MSSQAAAAITAPFPVATRTAARPQVALLVTSVASFMALLDVTVVNVAFPAIRDSFPSASLGDLSWVLNAYAVVFAALLVPAGRLADHLGRRRVFVAGLGVFGAASLLCAVAPSVTSLIVARGVQAAGAAMMLPTSLALLLGAFPAERRARAMGVWSATGAIAAAVGPPLGGLLIAAQDWRLVFVANVPVSAAAMVLAQRGLNESRDARVDRLPDLAGSALVAASIGLLSLALVEGNSWGWGSARVIGALVVSAALVPVAIARSSGHPFPVLDPALLRRGRFAAAALGCLIFSIGFFAVLLGNVLFLSEVWGYSTLRSGLAIVPSPLAAAAGALAASRVVARVGEVWVVAAGGLLLAAGASWLALRAGHQPEYLRVWVPGAVAIGSGIGLALPALNMAAARVIGPAEFAVGSAITAMARQIGGVLGVAVLVAITSGRLASGSLVGFDRNWLMVAAAGIATAGIAPALSRR